MPEETRRTRQTIAEALSKTFYRFIKPEEKSLQEALSLVATDRSIRSSSVEQVRGFYERGDEEKEAFFEILDSLGPEKIEVVFNQIYAALDSPEWLIRIREDLLRMIKAKSTEKPQPANLKALRKLDALFTDHFSRIFNFQYLVTRCCDARSTSISLLKFIAEKEGVHPTEHWWTFENRLNSPDHMILTLEHFKMPYVPLVYIEIALSRGLIRSIARIIGDKPKHFDPARADTAIFYSVNSTFNGLRKIALGEKMILRAKEYLELHYPQIRHFATLSPIPKFRSYLDAVLEKDDPRLSLNRKKIDANRKGRFFSKHEIQEIREELKKRREDADRLPVSGLLRAVLAEEEWYRNAVFRRRMKDPMIAITRYYMEREKRFDRKSGKHTAAAYDPVANFHLSNGAYLGSINYLGNAYPRGMQESYGMMLNYIYDEKRLDANKLLYGSGKILVKL